MQVTNRPTSAQILVRTDPEDDADGFDWRDVTLTCADQSAILLDGAPGVLGKVSLPIRFERVETNLKADPERKTPATAPPEKDGKRTADGVVAESRKRESTIGIVEEEQEQEQEQQEEEVRALARAEFPHCRLLLVACVPNHSLGAFTSISCAFRPAVP